MKLILFRLGVLLVAWLLAFALPAGIVALIGIPALALAWLGIGMILLASAYVAAIVIGVLIVFDGID